MEQHPITMPIAPADDHVAQQARERWDSVAKPLGSLGALEDLVTQIAALTGNVNVSTYPRCVTVLCADNGVVAEGVTSSPAEVTRVIAHNIVQGVSSISRMCAPHNIDCRAVDIGMFSPLSEPGIRNWRIAAGTKNIAHEAAMTRKQAIEAVYMGIELVHELKAEGYQLVGTGEMGIGNTTPATAMTCAFLGTDPEHVTGRGAGLSNDGLAHKTQVIKQALTVNAPNSSDPLDVLSKLGSFDIAGMCGMFLGGAIHRVPVIMDGLMSTVAAYCALQLRPECRVAILPSHASAEPAANLLLERMNMEPVLHAGMRLGEGTGSACLIPLLDMAVSLYATGPTYEDCGLVAHG